MRNKILSVLFAAAMLTVMVTGCGRKEKDQDAETASVTADTPSEAEASLSGEINVAAWNAAADGLKEIADKFMAQNPGTKININYVDAEYTKLYPALASGVGVPDIMQIQQTDFQSFLNNYEGSFANLSELIEPEKDNFAQAALGVVKGKDGGYYAFPWDIGPCALMYRTDVFEECEINPEEIKTWDDYYEAGKIILEKTGMRMLGFCYNGSSSSDYTKLFLAQQGGAYYDTDGKVNFNSKEMLQGIEYLKKLQDAGLTMDLPSEWDDRITALNANQLATMPYPAWYAGTLMSSVEDQSGKWSIVPMPSFDGVHSEVSLGGCVLAVSETSKSLELAKAFAAYAMMDNDANEINFKWGQFTSYSPSYETDAFKQVDEYFGLSRGAIFTQLTNSPVINFGPYFTDVDQNLRTAIGQIFVENADPATALSAAADAAQAAIDAK